MKLLTLMAFGVAPVIGAGLASLVGVDLNPTEAAGNPTAPSDVGRPDVAPTSVDDNSDRSLRLLGPARSDPFFSAPKPPPAPIAMVALPAAPIVPPPPPPPPPFPYRFVGRVTGPSGEPVVYLSKGERMLTVRDKSDLGDGYQVDEITDRHVVVTHGASRQKNVVEFGAESDSQRAP